MNDSNLNLEDLDFMFKNVLVRMIAKRSYKKIDAVGFSVGPFEEGMEFTVRQWIAEELAEVGIGTFHHEEEFSSASLQRVHWGEIQIQSGRRISALPEFFYPKVRKYLQELTRMMDGEADTSGEYHKALRLAQDVVAFRLRKIVGLSASPNVPESVLRNLCKEEKILYLYLSKMVSHWKTEILRLESVID